MHGHSSQCIVLSIEDSFNYRWLAESHDSCQESLLVRIWISRSAPIKSWEGQSKWLYLFGENLGIPTASRSCEELPKTAARRFGPRLDIWPVSKWQAWYLSMAAGMQVYSSQDPGHDKRWQWENDVNREYWWGSLGEEVPRTTSIFGDLRCSARLTNHSQPAERSVPATFHALWLINLFLPFPWRRKQEPRKLLEKKKNKKRGKNKQAYWFIIQVISHHGIRLMPTIGDCRVHATYIVRTPEYMWLVRESTLTNDVAVSSYSRLPILTKASVYSVDRSSAV